jgi:type IV secretory pathway VirB10-like protein
MSIVPRLRPPRSGRRPVRERRVRERRILFLGLAVSALIHLVVLGLASRWLEPADRAAATAPAPMPVEPPATMRAVTLAEPSIAALDPDVTAPAPPPPRAAVRPAPPTAAATEEAVAAVERRTAAERLAPRVVDPRIWRPMVLLPREPRLEDVQARLAEAMEMLSDSALAEAERAMRARDWTVEDADGGRWGISPGKLHLGSVTLPLPIFFPVDMEQQARDRYWAELEMQFDRAELLESFDARVRAIRERRDRERGDRQGAGRNGGR